jgi:hypothetical protein
MDRRSFLIGATSAILTAGFYRDVRRFIERKDEPLLVAPDQVKHQLFAVWHDGAYSLWLDAHPDDEPDWGMTRAEYLKYTWGYSRTRAIAELRKENGVTWREARELADETVDSNELLDWHYDEELGTGQAVRFLRDLNLGPDFAAGTGRGQVAFADYKCAGPDRWCSEAADMLSLSLLQGRLNELNTGVKVEISDSRVFGS